MPVLDSSVLAQIGGAIPNAIGAGLSRGVQLKDLLNQDQLDELKLGQEKQQEARTAGARKILSGFDISKPESATAAVSALSKGGYSDVAMDLQRQIQNMRTGDLQNQDMQLKQLQFAQDTFGPAAVGLKQTLMTKGLAMAQAQYQALRPQILAQLQSINPQLAAQFAQQLPATLPNDAGQVSQLLDREIAISQRAGTMLTQQRQQQQLDVSAAGETERERHDKAMESSGGRYGIKAPQTDAGQDLLDQFVGMTGGQGITLAQMRATDWDRLAAEGKTAKQLVSSGLSYKGNTRAASTVGQRTGNVAVLENSVDQAADQVIDALGGVDRTSIQSVNKALKAGKTQFGDPDEARYAAAVQTVVNEYSKVISGGTGTSTDSARAEAQAMLNTAQTPAQVRAVLDQMRRETAIVKSASARAMASVSGAQAAPATGQPPAANTPPAGPVTRLPPRNAQGWTLMRDAQGNQAYVSPDGRQFQAAQ